VLADLDVCPTRLAGPGGADTANGPTVSRLGVTGLSAGGDRHQLALCAHNPPVYRAGRGLVWPPEHLPRRRTTLQPLVRVALQGNWTSAGSQLLGCRTNGNSVLMAM